MSFQKGDQQIQGATRNEESAVELVDIYNQVEEESSSLPGSRNYFIPFQPQMHKIGNSKLRITIQLV